MPPHPPHPPRFVHENSFTGIFDQPRFEDPVLQKTRFYSTQDKTCEWNLRLAAFLISFTGFYNVNEAKGLRYNNVIGFIDKRKAKIATRSISFPKIQNNLWPYFCCLLALSTNEIMGYLKAKYCWRGVRDIAAMRVNHNKREALTMKCKLYGKE